MGLGWNLAGRCPTLQGHVSHTGIFGSTCGSGWGQDLKRMGKQERGRYKGAVKGLGEGICEGLGFSVQLSSN
eukprot:343779-Amphidinium_carterae.2